MKRRKRISQCLNCQTILSARDNFCPDCGQENHYTDFSVKELMGDFFGSLVNFDNKIWNTLKTIFRPGQITKQYVEGKRIRFVPPFKLYLFFSFIFFVMLSFSFRQASHSDFIQRLFTSINKSVPSKKIKITNAEYAQLKDANSDQIKSFIDSVFQHKSKWNTLNRETFYRWTDKNAFSGFRVGVLDDDFNMGIQKVAPNYAIFLDKKPEFDTVEVGGYRLTHKELQSIYGNSSQIDSLITAKWKNLGRFERIKLRNLINQVGIFTFGTVNQMTEFTDVQISKYLSITSYTTLLMMPFVSLLSLIFFRRKYKNIYVHLIHSLHLHTVIYLFTSVLMGIFLWTGFNTLFETLYAIYVVGLIVYFTISNKVLYQEKLWKTLFKSLVLIFLYFSIAFCIAMLIGFVSIVYA